MSQLLVAHIKASLLAAGVDLAGPCGAVQIVKRVAWALRSEGAGLLHKRPEQNGCNLHGERYAVDIVMYPDGRAFDCLSDAGGENGPMWHQIESLDPSLYRPAFDPGDAPMPEPDPDPEPAPPSAPDLAAILAKLTELDEGLDALGGIVVAHSETLAAILVQLDAVLQRQDRAISGRAGVLGTVTLRPQA